MELQVNINTMLDDFHLQHEFCSARRRLGILGSSGSGKSMTLKSIAGIETPDEGRILLNGSPLYDSGKKINVPARKRKIGYLFQNYALFPNMTVEENIKSSIQAARVEKTRIATKYIEQFGLGSLRSHYPQELSGGQQQRVALARIMAYEPDVILLDEPFSAMDEPLKVQMKKEMDDYLREYEGKMILVSHSRDEIYQFSDELLVLDKGKKVVFGDTKELFQCPQRVEAARLMGCENISRIQWIDDTHVEAVDWGIVLETEECVDTKSRYVGIYGQSIRLWEHGDSKKLIKLPVEENIRKEKAFTYAVSAYLKKNCKPMYFEVSKDYRVHLDHCEFIYLERGSLIFLN